MSYKIRQEISRCESSKIVDLNAERESTRIGKKIATSLLREQAKLKKNKKVDPLVKTYVSTINFIYDIVSSLIADSSLGKLAKEIEQNRGEYTPCYPPISPLTNTYYVQWELSDMQIGEDKETLTGIILDLADILGIEPQYEQLMYNVKNSRMGVYEVCGKEKSLVILRELITGKEFKTVTNATYKGIIGQLWYARRLPPVEGCGDYSLISTTPYVLINGKEEWLSFFDGHSVTLENIDTFMKFGPKENFWNEFISYGFCHYLEQVVFLSGLPEQMETLPCSDTFNDSARFSSILAFEYKRTQLVQNAKGNKPW